MDLYSQLEKAFEDQDMVAFKRLFKGYMKATKTSSAYFAELLGIHQDTLYKLGRGTLSRARVGKLLEIVKRMMENEGVLVKPLSRHHITILASLPEDDPFILGKHLERLRMYEQRLGFELSVEVGIAILKQYPTEAG